MRLRLFVLVFALACVLLPPSAQQRGQYQPGQFGLNAGVVPSPGFTYVNIAINYASTRLNAPNGDEVPVTGSYNVWAEENFFYYVPNAKVAGGNYAFGIAFPVLANGSLALPQNGVSGGGYGLADT